MKLKVAYEKFERGCWNASQVSRLELTSSKGCFKTTLLPRQHTLTPGTQMYSALVRKQEVNAAIFYATVASIAEISSFRLSKPKEAQLSHDI